MNIAEILPKALVVKVDVQTNIEPGLPDLFVFEAISMNAKTISTTINETKTHVAIEMIAEPFVLYKESFFTKIPEPITTPTTRASIENSPYLWLG
jgi:hypothetical protein